MPLSSAEVPLVLGMAGSAGAGGVGLAGMVGSTAGFLAGVGAGAGALGLVITDPPVQQLSYVVQPTPQVEQPPRNNRRSIPDNSRNPSRYSRSSHSSLSWCSMASSTNSRASSSRAIATSPTTPPATSPATAAKQPPTGVRLRGRARQGHRHRNADQQALPTRSHLPYSLRLVQQTKYPNLTYKHSSRLLKIKEPGVSCAIPQTAKNTQFG